jgi:glycosyltransferase involved in cell wall biosynthesis/pimeloyl-ACP methyl ester carboxylesterase
LTAATPVSIGHNFGWLHHANGDRGVVMCAAMGYEALCAHQSWRVLADILAAAGLPTLRFDYPGAGDSLDDANDLLPYDSWRRSIKEATAWMRETLGVQEIVLIGFRIGATLAAEAGGASHLVQLAPVVKGSAYLRELRILSRMLAERESGPRERGASENEINLEGFTTSAALLSVIKNIDLTELSSCPARRVLIMTEGSARHVEGYAARLVELGATVETMTLENYEAMAPARAPRPAPISDFERIVAWARSGARPKVAPPPPAGVLCGGSFTERVVRFGEDGALAGVLCAPSVGKAKSLVLLLNTGANYHIGCGRSFVDCARSLAAKGVATLRMDSLGIGDSDPVALGARSVLYREARHADVFRALDWGCESGFSDFYLAGVCSGATQAILSAVKDSRVKGVVLGNIQVFTNPRDEAAVEAHLSLALGATSTYLAKAMSLRTWARVLTSEAGFSKLLAIVVGVLRRNVAAYWTKTMPMPGVFGSISARAREAYSHFETLSARGARVIVLHGDADAGLEELAICFGPNARCLRALPGVRLTTIPGLDHAFSSMRARKLLTDEIATLVGAAPNSTANALPSAQPTTSCSMPPSSPDATRPEAVICVPTFRRPEMLRATLESLVAQQTSVAFAVVVIDNDAEANEGIEIARAFFADGRLKGYVAREDRQGNVYAINAAFGMARVAFPATEYFLMIDDDEIAGPIWLDQMVAAARRDSADIVGGPVFPIFPADVKTAFRDHPVYWPTYSKSGPVPMIYGTGNCLITRRVFEGLPNATFDPAFNFLGGGDTEFFTRCRKAGFKFHWCHEASINEQVTPNRLALSWVMRRSIATGVINYRIDRLAAQSVLDRARLAAKNIAVAPISLQRAALILAESKHPFAALHPIGVALGRWLASFGLDPQPYRRRAQEPNSPR